MTGKKKKSNKIMMIIIDDADRREPAADERDERRETSAADTRDAMRVGRRRATHSNGGPTAATPSAERRVPSRGGRRRLGPGRSGAARPLDAGRGSRRGRERRAPLKTVVRPPRIHVMIIIINNLVRDRCGYAWRRGTRIDSPRVPRL